VELDPLSPMINSTLAFYYFREGDFVKALEIEKRAVDLTPDYGEYHFGLMMIYGKLGMLDDARREADKGVTLVEGVYPKVRLGMDMFLAYILGDKTKVASLLPEVEAQRAQAGANAYEIAGAHFFLGENDKGFDWLEKAYSEGDKNIWSIASDPDLKGIRTDQRYFDLLKRLGLHELASRET